MSDFLFHVTRQAFPLWHRSLLRPVGETGRRSVENRKERLRDYASSPEKVVRRQP